MSPACNGTDERLDVLIAEFRTLIAEMRITREEWKRMIEEVAALPREATVGHVDVTSHNDGKLKLARKAPVTAGKTAR